MRFTLTVPDDLNSQIEGLCASQEMSKNAWVVSAITTFIEHCTTDGAEVAPLDTAVVQEVVQSLTTERDQAREALAMVTAERDRLIGEVTEVDRLRSDIATRDQLLNEKRDEVSWLRGQVALLNDKLTPATLPEQAGPGRKPWWRFWE